MRLDFLLGLEVEDLQCSTRCDATFVIYLCASMSSSPTLECKNLLVWVHNSRVRCNWSSDEIVGICEVDNDNLVLLVDLLAYTNEMV